MWSRTNSTVLGAEKINLNGQLSRDIQIIDIYMQSVCVSLHNVWGKGCRPLYNLNLSYISSFEAVSPALILRARHLIQYQSSTLARKACSFPRNQTLMSSPELDLLRNLVSTPAEALIQSPLKASLR